MAVDVGFERKGDENGGTAMGRVGEETFLLVKTERSRGGVNVLAYSSRGRLDRQCSCE